MLEESITVGCGIVIGLALGLTGGGGSIFAVPMLIYLIGLDVKRAVPVSLAAVAMTACIGAIHAARNHMLDWRPAIVFACGGAIGAPLGTLLSHSIADVYILVGFAMLTVFVGTRMWRRSLTQREESRVVRGHPVGESSGAVCRLAPDGKLRFTAPCMAVLSVAGIGTGILAGVFGVGGGFLIVPALITITSMGIHRAVATSLVVITATGLSGALGAILAGKMVWPVLIPFVLGGGIGMLAGRALAGRLAGPTLQRIFATAILFVGVFVLVRQWLHLQTPGGG